ncbi:hypothetical protein ACU4GR_07500 [Methylobacterium oryzae CBMB20]
MRFKFWINLQKGILGERMLRRLRFQLFSLMLRFSPETQREVKSSETATIIRDEVEPIGSFIGDAIVVPVFLGTQAATALAFIMMQNMWLGLAAGGMVAVQMIVIPRPAARDHPPQPSSARSRPAQPRRPRRRGARRPAGGAAQRYRPLGAGGDRRPALPACYDLRLRIYRRKFAVKYLNNLLAQVTPFLFYAIGGYFALKGELDIGQLVAVSWPPIATCPAPEGADRLGSAAPRRRGEIRDRGGAFRARSACGRRSRTRSARRPARKPAPDRRLWSCVTRRAASLVEITDAEVRLPARLAPGSVRARWLRNSSRVLGGSAERRPAARSGSACMICRPCRDAALAHRIAFAGVEPVLFPGTVRDNALYGLRDPAAADERPRSQQDADQRGGEDRQSVRQHRRTPGSTTERLGVRDAGDLDERLLDLLGRLDLGGRPLPVRPRGAQLGRPRYPGRPAHDRGAGAPARALRPATASPTS